MDADAVRGYRVNNHSLCLSREVVLRGSPRFISESDIHKDSPAAKPLVDKLCAVVGLSQEEREEGLVPHQSFCIAHQDSPKGALQRVRWCRVTPRREAGKLRDIIGCSSRSCNIRKAPLVVK